MAEHRPKKGQIVIRGGKRIISDGKGGGRVVTAKDDARTRIKKATAAKKAPPIPGVVTSRVPRTQKELRKARKKVKVKRPDAGKDEPIRVGIQAAFEDARKRKK